MQRDTRARDLFIEELSIFMNEVGLPRMAGRVLGLLLVCDPPHQSAAEIARALQASKGSISTMTRMLIGMGFVERVGVPQHRQSYFRVRPGVWAGQLQAQVGKVATARGLAARGLRVLADGGNGGDPRLMEMHDLYEFLERELPTLLTRWNEEFAAKLANGETFSSTAA